MLEISPHPKAAMTVKKAPIWSENAITSVKCTKSMKLATGSMYRV